MTARHFMIDGRVQGVGFRYFVVRAAQGLGIAGWVRNLPDGRVEVIGQADDAALSAFEGRLWEGPPAALVSKVENRRADDAVRWNDFRVLPTPW